MDKNPYFMSGLEFTAKKTNETYRGGSEIRLQYRGSPSQQWTTVNRNSCNLYLLKDGKLQFKGKYDYWPTYGVRLETEVYFLKFLFDSDPLTKTPEVTEEMLVDTAP
eukprot:TRINITY_DN5130_c0_g1_i5.p1 TRINITY_DN5130_c0_g1~~TRINITY_DN5130_c0_g1_i5.p1  ORF type:complete len:107 (+),score=16.79 TRINITY_DN5130_c0_g1_i5:99-419(+)